MALAPDSVQSMPARLRRAPMAVFQRTLGQDTTDTRVCYHATLYSAPRSDFVPTARFCKYEMKSNACTNAGKAAVRLP